MNVCELYTINIQARTNDVQFLMGIIFNFFLITYRDIIETLKTKVFIIAHNFISILYSFHIHF